MIVYCLSSGMSGKLNLLPGGSPKPQCDLIILLWIDSTTTKFISSVHPNQMSVRPKVQLFLSTTTSCGSIVIVQAPQPSGYDPVIAKTSSTTKGRRKHNTIIKNKI